MASELKAGAALNYISIAVSLATSFLLTPFVIKSLGVEEYGLFMLSGSVIMWIALTDFGLGGTVSKYVTTYHAKGEKDAEAHFLGQSLMLFSVLGILTLVVGVACFFYLDAFFPDLSEEQHETLEILYLLTLGNLILAFPLRPLGCVPGAYLKFIIPGVVGLVFTLFNTGLTVLLLWWGYKAIGLTILAVGMGVARLLWGVYYTFRCLGVRIVFGKPDIRLYREMFTFSFWILLNQLMDLFYWRAGTPILASMSGMTAVTLFTIGISFVQYFVTASTAISGVISPKVMHMVALEASKEELTQVMIRVGRMQLVILMLVLSGFTVYGQSFLHLWVGASVGEHTSLVWLGSLIILIPSLIPLTQNTGLALLQAMNIHKGRAAILFYSSLLCVVSGAILSYYYGAIGMFIGTGVSNIVGQCIMINLYYQRKAGLNIARFFKRTYFPLLIPTMVVVASGYVLTYYWNIESWSELALAVVAYTIIYSLVFWLMYLSRDEQEILLAPMRKLLRN